MPQKRAVSPREIITASSPVRSPTRTSPVKSPTQRRRRGSRLSIVFPLIILVVIFSWTRSFQENTELMQTLMQDRQENTELVRTLVQDNNQETLVQDRQENTEINQTLVQDRQENTEVNQTLVQDHEEYALYGSVATLFLAPFGAPEGSEKHRIELNTLQALTLLRPEIDVIAFSKDVDHIRSFCDPLKIRVMDNFRTNPHGTPILKSMFEVLENDTKVESAFLGYLNADIVFDENLIKTLQEIKRGIDKGVIKPYLLAVGQRINAQTNGTTFFKTYSDGRLIDDRAKLNQLISDLKQKERGKKFRPDAEDYFIITPGTFDYAAMPDFVIGRPAYDNQLVDHIFHKNTTHSLIDVTKTVTAIHQTGADGNKAGHNTSRPDLKWNLQYKKEWQFDHQTTLHANWETRQKNSNLPGDEIALFQRPPWKPPQSAKQRLAASRRRFVTQSRASQQKQLALQSTRSQQQQKGVTSKPQYSPFRHEVQGGHTILSANDKDE